MRFPSHIFGQKAILVEKRKLSRELLHHGRRVGEEEKTEIRVVSGETNLIPHIDISVVVAENNSIVKPKC